MLSALRNARGSDPVLGPPLTSHCGRRPACCQVGSEGMVASTGLTVGMGVVVALLIRTTTTMASCRRARADRAHRLVPPGAGQEPRQPPHPDAAGGPCRLVAMHRDVANQIRGILKTFGLVLGKVAAGKFEARVRQLIAGNSLLVEVIEALLKVWRTTGEQLVTLHRRVLRLTQTDETCRRLMTVPGVGAV